MCCLQMTLEEAIGYVASDELIEVRPVDSSTHCEILNILYEYWELIAPGDLIPRYFPDLGFGCVKCYNSFSLFRLRQNPYG